MIFQLKITLKNSKPPIWRRLEVKDSMTFHELHQAIQIAFEWLDSHLHGFDIKKSNSHQVLDFISIGPIEEEDYGMAGFEYDEEEVLLKDVFKKGER
ncbi:plasmid pRiA4b ORF-3 family protein [Bacillus sp. Marseille-P3661]|uniref:plasmid pRiA4b ORF-3 family protein n=1 Tax=Bacillus sp. Marseille-P3661 TaxID=1936234 RepID=UPI000C861E89|nr:plasmid pRiA4b ORF-3 family protein [Bacillus sp. Marseille-P3661]